MSNVISYTTDDIRDLYQKSVKICGKKDAATLTAARLISEGLPDVADALHRLGNADAATSMGAIEGLGKVFIEGFERLAGALDRTDP